MRFLIRWVKILVPPQQILNLIRIPHFIWQFYKYSALQGGGVRVVDTYPCLTDAVINTPFDAHYFYQSAWLGRQLASHRPARHYDIGSDVRMVAVLSAFVPTEFIDYRPLQVNLNGLDSHAGSILNLPYESGTLKSLSCLHVIEHIGLGRYGDPLDAEGSRKSIVELVRILGKGGFLYVSVPVGRERVCFNAHRVFDPVGFQGLFGELTLKSFSFVNDRGEFRGNAEPAQAADCDYACGMYVFEKR